MPMCDERSPMKAPTKSCDPAKLAYPVLASNKLDGVRGFVRGGKLLSNSLKPIPNLEAQRLYGRAELEGLDGELVCGPPNAQDCCRRTVSCVMSERSDDEKHLAFYVFDRVVDGREDEPFSVRLTRASGKATTGRSPGLRLLPHYEAQSEEELLEMEAKALADGYEGLMIRSLSGRYKWGPNRASAREGLIFKLKRYADAEARVVEFIEGTVNTNEAVRSETGRSKRTSHKAGKVPSGMVGTIRARDVLTGVVIDVGPGRMSHEDRAEAWAIFKKDPSIYAGMLFTYKHFPRGTKDAPRHAQFKCWRDERDLPAKPKRRGSK